MCLVMPNIVPLCIYLYFSVCVCLIGECMCSYPVTKAVQRYVGTPLCVHLCLFASQTIVVSETVQQRPAPLKAYQSLGPSSLHLARESHFDISPTLPLILH